MSDRGALLRRLAPLALMLVLAGAVVLDLDAGLRLPSADATAADEMLDALDGVTDESVVLVGFDPDIGTYAEIRPTARALIADLLARQATLAFVSMTPEGRALALAELERMRGLEANPRQIVDLGFLPGAEAALVALARHVTPNAGRTVTGPDAGVARVDLALVVGGIDLGPRSWVEQVAPRTDGLPMIAVAPSVLLPELLPYRDSGQLEALIATPRDGAAYRDAAELGRLERMAEPGAGPSPLALLAGLLVAVAVLGQAVARRLADLLRAARREAA
jgi:hypothetical protein